MCLFFVFVQYVGRGIGYRSETPNEFWLALGSFLPLDSVRPFFTTDNGLGYYYEVPGTLLTGTWYLFVVKSTAVWR